MRRKLALMRIKQKRCNIIEDFTTFMQREFDNNLIDVQNLIENNQRMLGYVGKDMFLKSMQEI